MSDEDTVLVNENGKNFIGERWESTISADEVEDWWARHSCADSSDSDSEIHENESLFREKTYFAENHLAREEKQFHVAFDENHEILHLKSGLDGDVKVTWRGKPYDMCIPIESNTYSSDSKCSVPKHSTRVSHPLCLIQPTIGIGMRGDVDEEDVETANTGTLEHVTNHESDKECDPNNRKEKVLHGLHDCESESGHLNQSIGPAEHAEQKSHNDSLDGEVPTSKKSRPLPRSRKHIGPDDEDFHEKKLADGTSDTSWEEEPLPEVTGPTTTSLYKESKEFNRQMKFVRSLSRGDRVTVIQSGIKEGGRILRVHASGLVDVRLRCHVTRLGVSPSMLQKYQAPRQQVSRRRQSVDDHRPKNRKHHDSSPDSRSSEEGTGTRRHRYLRRERKDSEVGSVRQHRQWRSVSRRYTRPSADLSDESGDGNRSFRNRESYSHRGRIQHRDTRDVEQKSVGRTDPQRVQVARRWRNVRNTVVSHNGDSDGLRNGSDTSRDTIRDRGRRNAEHSVTRKLQNSSRVVREVGDGEQHSDQFRRQPGRQKHEGSSSHSADVIGVGDDVEAKDTAYGKWYPGKVTKVQSTRLGREFKILLNSGSRSRTVPEKWVRRAKGSDEMHTINRGDRVEARFQKGKKYFPGRVTSVNANGRFCIQYDDGDQESNVARELVRLIPQASKFSTALKTTRNDNKTFDKSSELQYQGKQDIARLQYLYKREDRVTILNVSSLLRKILGAPVSEAVQQKISQFGEDEGLSTIDTLSFDDVCFLYGKLQEDLRPVGHDQIRNRLELENIATKLPTVDSIELRSRFSVGDCIEARYGSNPRGEWCAGTVLKVHANDTYDIAYDDGDSERCVKSEFIRLICSPR